MSSAVVPPDDAVRAMVASGITVAVAAGNGWGNGTVGAVAHGIEYCAEERCAGERAGGIVHADHRGTQRHRSETVAHRLAACCATGHLKRIRCIDLARREHEHDTVGHVGRGTHGPVEHPAPAELLELFRAPEPLARTARNHDGPHGFRHVNRG